MKQLDGTGMKRLHREWRRRTPTRLALVLDSVQTPYNVGAIVRSAAAYRVDHLWLAGSALGPDHPGVGKTALGTDRYLRWSRVPTGPAGVEAARAEGYRVVGIELTATAVPLHQVALGDHDVCLVLGHEDHGVGPATLDACDVVAFLPLLGRVGSLNVATAAAIACYEARRQAWPD
ncbi:MAG: TrmH family RNA methyltransferase [Acidimicrobiia bacterium]